MSNPKCSSPHNPSNRRDFIHHRNTNMTKTILAAVQSEPQSPIDHLWRLFPQLKNSVMVNRISSTIGVWRTFRLLDGSYLMIAATEDQGIYTEPIDPDERDIYESLWQSLGSRAIGGPVDDGSGHGIMFASDKYYQELDRILDEALVQELGARDGE
jgi:hypothetical protein